MSGYARAHRGRWDHPLFKNKQEAAVWAWMTDTARFKAHSFQTRFGMVHLNRGQLLMSERGIAEDFGLHKNTVRRLLRCMVDANMITLNSDHDASRAGTIVTIVNYERYQGDTPLPESPRDQGGTACGTKTGPRRDHNGTTREEREKREEGEEERISSIGEPIDQRSRAAGEPALPKTDDVGEAFAAYQALRAQFVPGARALTLTPPRRTKLAARLLEIGGRDAWHDVLRQIRASAFLRGEKSRDGRFVAEIDWLLEPRNLTKLREGNFDDRPQNRPGGGGPRGPARSAASSIFAARDRLLGDRPPPGTDL